MPGLSGKYINGYSKLEQKNFNTVSFTEDEAIIFKGKQVVNAISTIEQKLKKLEEAYDKVAKKFEDMQKCTANGKKMTTKNTDDSDAKKIIKYGKKCRTRANNEHNRKKKFDDLIAKVHTYATDIDKTTNTTLDTGNDLKNDNASSIE